MPLTRRFRISLLEALGLITGLGIGIGALLAASELVMHAVVTVHLLLLLVALSAALANPQQRPEWLAFLGGTLVYLFVVSTQSQVAENWNSYHVFLDRLMRLTLPWGQGSIWFLKIAHLELSLLCGVVCWLLTRALRRDTSPVGP